MKTLTYALVLFGLISVIPVQAARTGRPTVIITTTSSTSGSVSPS